MKKIVLAYSGGLDTSYCLKKLSNEGNQVHAININTGGLSKNDILIELTNGILTVSYDGPESNNDAEDHNLVYRGIAKRAFKQQFTLAEDVIVQGAELENGLLLINLEKIIPEEKKPKIIDIKTPKKILGKK